MFSNFQQNELQFDSILSSNDWEDPELVLHHGADLEKIRMWQKATSFATWRAMQQCRYHHDSLTLVDIC